MSRPPSWPPATWPGPPRSATSPDETSTRRTPAPASWAAGTSCKTTRYSRSATPSAKATPPPPLRPFFVPPPPRAAPAATSRTKKLTRAKADLDRLLPGLGGRFYPDEHKVADRIRQISLARKVGPYLRYAIGTAPAGGPGSTSTCQVSDQQAGTPEATGPGPADTWQGTGSGAPGKPALTWWSGQAAIDAEAATDGWYALLTNLDATETAAAVLLRYKAQEAVERRYGNLKGPLAVAPMFLNSNRRIAALITVISLALLVFCLIEREARRNLAPETKIDGLYNRQPARPTGRLILTALASLQLTPATATSPAQITRPTPVPARPPDLLGGRPPRPGPQPRTAPAAQLGFDPPLRRFQPQLLQPTCLRCDQRPARHIR